MNHAKDAKQEVLTRLLEVARLIRRRGAPDEAEAVLPYERQFEADLKAHEAETAMLPGLENRKAVAA
jgi:hypothetical protein